jgi:hypothetical protein
LADRALNNFEHRLGGLLAKQAMADYVTGMIVDDADQVDRVHALELESKNVDLP